MLKLRLITAAVLAAAFLAGLFFLPPQWFVFVLLLVTLLGALEWAKLVSIQTKMGQGGFVLLVIAISAILAQFRDFATPINLIATLFWLGLAWLLTTHPRYQEKRVLFLFLAAFSLAFAFFALSVLLLSSSNGPWWILGLFGVIWGADAAAYFTGRRFGQKKLAPRISPGKTIEGLKGSLFAIFALALISGTIVWEGSYSSILLWVVVCLITAAMSIVGDLYVSMNKRIVGVKDSGSLLPGHGGVLDRIDSTLSAAPVYVLCVNALFI